MLRKRFLKLPVLFLFALMTIAVLGCSMDSYTSVSKYNNRRNIITTGYGSDQLLRTPILENECDIQYYAHLNLETAPEMEKSVILEARNRIIFRYSWVADEVNGRVLDKNGGVIKELPHFSDLFPEDWDEPIVNSKVDKDYYKK